MVCFSHFAWALVLRENYRNVESSFKPSFAVLDPKKSRRNVLWIAENLRQLYPVEIADILALKVELDVFWNYLKEKKEDKEMNARMAADFAVQLHLEMWLFASAARIYRFWLTVALSVCKSETYKSPANWKFWKKIWEVRWQRRD